MNEAKLADKFATPNSSKLAQILLQLRGVDPQVGMCNLQPSEIQLWSESFKVVSYHAVVTILMNSINLNLYVDV